MTDKIEPMVIGALTASFDQTVTLETHPDHGGESLEMTRSEFAALIRWGAAALAQTLEIVRTGSGEGEE